MLQARTRDLCLTSRPTQSFSPTRSPYSHDEREWRYRDQAVVMMGLSGLFQGQRDLEPERLIFIDETAASTGW